MVADKNTEVRNTYKEHFDNKVRGTEITEGMQVLLHEPAKSNVGFARKMIQPFSGPFIVRKRVAPKVIDISKTLTGKIKRVNIERVKPFISETKKYRVLNPADQGSGNVTINAVRITESFDDMFVPINRYPDKISTVHRFSQSKLQRLTLSPDTFPQIIGAREDRGRTRLAVSATSMSDNHKLRRNVCKRRSPGNEEVKRGGIVENKELVVRGTSRPPLLKRTLIDVGLDF